MGEKRARRQEEELLFQPVLRLDSCTLVMLTKVSKSQDQALIPVLRENRHRYPKAMMVAPHLTGLIYLALG